MEVSSLPEKYVHVNKKGLPVVIAIQDKVEKKDYEISLSDLVKFFKSKGLIQEVTAQGILDTNDIRNTFHLSKARTKQCGEAQVNEAVDLLLHTVKTAPNWLLKKI